MKIDNDFHRVSRLNKAHITIVIALILAAHEKFRFLPPHQGRISFQTIGKPDSSHISSIPTPFYVFCLSSKLDSKQSVMAKKSSIERLI